MTTSFILNNDIKSIEPYRDRKHYHPAKTKDEVRLEDRDQVIRACLKKADYDWQSRTTTIYEKLYDTSVPGDADLYHENYLTYLQAGYANHLKIELAPHHLWYTILCEIAQAVIRDDVLHRPLFTDSPEKKTIVVMCNSEDEPLRMDSIYSQLKHLVPIDTTLFLPTFSTTTEMSRMACLAAFLETCSPYYNYMMLACGYPAIRIAGTEDDWSQMVLNLSALEDEFRRVGSPVADWIRDSAAPVASQLLEAVIKLNKGDWLGKIFTQQRCGSGSQMTVDGWFSRLFMLQPRGQREVCNFATHITKVPYTTLPSGQHWNLCFALTHSKIDADGFYQPDFGWMQVQKLPVPEVIRHKE